MADRRLVRGDQGGRGRGDHHGPAARRGDRRAGRHRLAICDHRFAAELDAANLGITAIGYGGDGDDDLVRRCEGRDASFPAVATAADDVALLAPTSGTTGKPKATMHFHRDVLAIQDTFGRHVLQASADDLFLGTPPVGFTFGLGGLVVFPFSIGACTMLLERASPDELAEVVGEPLAEEGVTTTSGWVTHRLGGFPRAGDTLALGAYELRVEQTDGMRVSRLKLTGHAEPTETVFRAPPDGA